MKKIVILSLILSLSFITGCGCDKKDTTKDNEPKNPTEEKQETGQEVINERGQLPDKEVNGMKFTNASISYVDDMATFLATVENTTDKTISLDIFNLVFKDKDGKQIATIPAYVADKLEAGESKSVVAQVNMDLTKVYEVEYEF